MSWSSKLLHARQMLQECLADKPKPAAPAPSFLPPCSRQRRVTVSPGANGRPSRRPADPSDGPAARGAIPFAQEREERGQAGADPPKAWPAQGLLRFPARASACPPSPSRLSRVSARPAARPGIRGAASTPSGQTGEDRRATKLRKRLWAPRTILRAARADPRPIVRRTRRFEFVSHQT